MQKIEYRAVIKFLTKQGKSLQIILEEFLKIVHEHLSMTKVSARWVLRMLTPPQKQQRVKCPQGLLALCNEDTDGILNRIVTGDESWVHHYEPESKLDSMQWHKKGVAPPKKFKVSLSAGKLMTTVYWDSEGILLFEYKDKSVSVTEECYATILEQLKQKKERKIKQRCPALARQCARPQEPCCPGCPAQS